jgi:hypothetical protein
MPKVTAKILSVEVRVNRLAGLEPQRFENKQIAGEPDRKGREDEVEAHGERKLRAGENHWIEGLEHRLGPSPVLTIVQAKGWPKVSQT